MKGKNQRAGTRKTELTIMTVSALALALLMTIHTAAAQGTGLPFACFADGEVFNMDGTPTGTGVNVQIRNLDTGETINTTTGYPNYPPVEMYNNDYKSVFTCIAGKDRVSIKAWNGTHEGYGEVDVPKDSQALLNITLDKKTEDAKEGVLETMFRKIMSYFTRR